MPSTGRDRSARPVPLARGAVEVRRIAGRAEALSRQAGASPDPGVHAMSLADELRRLPERALGGDLRRLLTVALWAVTAIGLTETYALPPIGSTSARAAVSTHDDAMTHERRPRRGRPLSAQARARAARRREQARLGARRAHRRRVTGLIVITAMTIRTDMQVQSLCSPPPRASATRSTCRSRSTTCPPGIAWLAARRAPARRRGPRRPARVAARAPDLLSR